MQCPSLSVSELARLVTRIPVYTVPPFWTAELAVPVASLAASLPAEWVSVKLDDGIMTSETFCLKIRCPKKTTHRAGQHESRSCCTARLPARTLPARFFQPCRASKPSSRPLLPRLSLEVRAKACEMSAESFDTQTRFILSACQILTCKHAVCISLPSSHGAYCNMVSFCNSWQHLLAQL